MITARTKKQLIIFVIMSQHILSPLVHVIVQPFFVISTLHMPIVMLQVQTIIPFIMQHMLHIPPASIWQRFCIIEHAVASSHVQLTFIPPVTFSIVIVQRGIIIMFIGIAVPAGDVIGFIPMPAIRSVMNPAMVPTTRSATCSISSPRLAKW